MGTFLCSVLTVFFIVTVLVHLNLTPAHAQEPPLQHAPDVLPGVEPHMLTADYWIRLQDDADKVIMTSLEIEQDALFSKGAEASFRSEAERDA